MWKKGFFLLVFSFCILGLTGCEDVYELTEEETKLIAEYSAELLLKYDLNYDDRIEEGYQEAEKLESTEADQDTEVPAAEDVTETSESTEEVSTENPEKGKDVSGIIENDNATTESQDLVGTEGDIAKIAGLKGISIQYKDYLITDQYPATDEDGKFIYLEAAKGYQLLVVRFGVHNITDSAVDISLIDKELDYRIVCNGTKAANPMLTILMDDLGTLETSINAQEEQDAVLVFQISNDMKDKLESIDFYITYNGLENVVKIL